jgi:hypothetical protein
MYFMHFGVQARLACGYGREKNESFLAASAASF